MHRWENDPEQSPHYYCTVGAYKALMDRKYCQQFFYDERKNPDDALVEACEAGTRPDMILATALLQLGDDNIAPETYAYIRDELKIPVVMMWLESAPDVVHWADDYAPSVTANIFVDTSEEWKKETQFLDKTFWVPEPKDPRIFNRNGGAKRDITMSFCGTIFGRIDRALTYAWLMGHGWHVQLFGGQHQDKVKIDAYADMLRRSLCTLNFTNALTFQHLNARTSEALMCGAFLLETESAETEKLLEPYIHYVPFAVPFQEMPNFEVRWNPGDLIQRISYFTGLGRSEMERIAEKGHQRAMELFDGRRFWKTVFDLAGIA